MARSHPGGPGTEHIAVADHRPDGSGVEEEMGHEELRSLVDRAKRAMEPFVELHPECSKG
jgi:hypothetical protein